jgi:hypothetical protein
MHVLVQIAPGRLQIKAKARSVQVPVMSTFNAEMEPAGGELNSYDNDNKPN